MRHLEKTSIKILPFHLIAEADRFVRRCENIDIGQDVSNESAFKVFCDPYAEIITPKKVFAIYNNTSSSFNTEFTKGLFAASHCYDRVYFFYGKLAFRRYAENRIKISRLFPSDVLVFAPDAALFASSTLTSIAVKKAMSQFQAE